MPQLILADKSDLFRRSMASVLGREGYEVLVADSGQKVLKLLQETRPAALILDTEVENPQGLEILRQIKADARLKRVPVVVVSRDSAPANVSTAYRIGAEGYVVKPVELEDLIKLLAKFQVPVPALNAPVTVECNGQKLLGKVRFLDDYGGIYLDKELPETVAPVGAQAVLSFPVNKEVYYQAVRVYEENEQGIGLYPMGAASPKEEPPLQKLNHANLRARYLLPGSFMRLATIGELSSAGFKLRGLNQEPRFNSPVTVTVYPPSGGVEGGYALEGKITGFQPQPGEPGLFEAEVEPNEPLPVAHVQLLSELFSGRPMRPVAAKEVAV